MHKKYPVILVYRNQPIVVSETFVYNQSMRLRRHVPYFLGDKQPKGMHMNLPSDKVYLINQGGHYGLLREIGWKLSGHIPSDVSRWIERLHPALIHAHFGSDGALTIPIAKRFNIPLVVSFHGTDATLKDEYILSSSYFSHRMYLLHRAELARVANRVIVQSEFLKKIVIEQHGFPEKKIVLIRHGIDINNFKPVTGNTEYGHILYVGRIIELKGLHYLLRAISLLKDKYPELRLTVIGEGPERKGLELTAKRELAERVTFLGAQHHSVVQEYMSRAYIFCMPSITMPSGQAESQGMVFVEAMAMKVPAVSFNSGGIPEVILHNKTGFLAQEKDVFELAKHLSTLLENKELRNQMGNAGRTWVEQEFNLEIQNNELENLYDEVINSTH